MARTKQVAKKPSRKSTGGKIMKKPSRVSEGTKRGGMRKKPGSAMRQLGKA